MGRKLRTRRWRSAGSLPMRGGVEGGFWSTEERERKREVVCAGWYRRVGSRGENCQRTSAVGTALVEFLSASSSYQTTILIADYIFSSLAGIVYSPQATMPG
jgi:hypothetical protein